jgi:fructokinase
MIAVAGEALIDLIIGPAGRADVRPGGGPFNAARTIARLGQAAVFVGRTSGDRVGQLLRDCLAADGVQLGVPDPAAEPTTLAMVHLGAAGVPEYSFYLTGTAASELDYGQLRAALPAWPDALHVGSLGLAMDPIGASLESLITSAPETTLVMLDPNCRPEAITTRPQYLGRLQRIAGRADVVKASVEDLAYLSPGASIEAAAAALLRAGPALVLVSDGPRPARAFTAGDEVSVPVPAAEVADTVGAGDALGGAFLSWWASRQRTRDDLRRVDEVAMAVRAAVEVSALTCTRSGAEPPWAAELAGRPGWS